MEEENGINIEDLKRRVNAGESVISRPSNPVMGGDLNFQKLGKYDEGLRRGGDQGAVRAGNQSNLKAWGNAAVQAVSELGLGTLEGAGYLLDFQGIAKSFAGTEREFGNWFSDIMKSGKEHINQEVAPIYGGDGFQPGTWKFWAKNFSSIVSSLSLMVPAAGVTRLASAGAKMAGRANIARKASGKSFSEIRQIIEKGNFITNASSGAKLATKGFTGALTSRMMENTMEASETAKSTYDKLIAEGMEEDKAKEEAGRQASNVWRANLANLIPDTFQYIMMFGAADNILKGIAKSTKKKLAEIGKTMASEAVEEGLQYGIQQQAKEDSVFGTLGAAVANVGDYLDDDEFKTAVLMGAVGGGVFSTIGAVTDKNVLKPNADKFRKWIEGYAKDNKYEQEKQERETIFSNTPEQNANLKEFADENTRKKIEEYEQMFETADNIITAQNEKAPVSTEIEQEQVHTEASIQANAKQQQKTREELGQMEAEAATYKSISDIQKEDLSDAVIVDLSTKILKEKVDKAKNEKSDLGSIILEYADEIVPADTPKPSKADKANPKYSEIEHKVETELLPAKAEEQALKEKKAKLKDPVAYEAEQKDKEVRQKKAALAETNDVEAIKEATKDPDVGKEALEKLEKLTEEIIQQIPNKEYTSFEEVIAQVPEAEAIRDVKLPSGKTVEETLVTAPEQTPMGQTLLSFGTPQPQVENVTDAPTLENSPFTEPVIPVETITEPVQTNMPEEIPVENEGLDMWHPLRGYGVDMWLKHEYAKDKDGNIKKDENGEKIIKTRWGRIDKENNKPYDWAKVFDVSVDQIKDVIRHFYKYANQPVYIISNSNIDWNSKNPAQNNFEMLYAVKVDGKFVPFDIFRDLGKVAQNITMNGKVMNPNFRKPYELHKKMRKELFPLMQANKGQTVSLPYTIQATSYIKGRHNNGDQTRTLEELGGDFKLGMFEDSGKMYDTVRETLPEYNETDAVERSQKRQGFVYLLAKDTFGKLRWNRVFTKSIHEVPEVMEEITSIINKVQAASQFLLDNGITTSSLWVKKNNKLVPDAILALKEKIKKNPENYKDPERFLDWVDNYADYAKELNGLVRYNVETKTKDGRIIKKKEPSLGLYTFLLSSKEYVDERKVFNTRKYQEAIGMIDRSGGTIKSKPIQISSQKINRKGYNKKVAKYLQTNLNSLTDQFVSPTFFFGTETKPVKNYEAPKSQSTSTLQAKNENGELFSEETITKGKSKGKKRRVFKKDTTEYVEGDEIKITTFSSKIDEKDVTLGGRKMTKKELIDEYDLDEDSIEALDFLMDEEIIVLHKVKISPENSRFNSLVEVRTKGEKFTLTLNKSLESTNNNSQTPVDKLKIQDLKTKVGDKGIGVEEFKNQEINKIKQDSDLSENEKDFLITIIKLTIEKSGLNPLILDDITLSKSTNPNEYPKVYEKFAYRKARDFNKRAVRYHSLHNKTAAKLIKQYLGDRFLLAHKLELAAEYEGVSGLPDNLAELEQNKKPLLKPKTKLPTINLGGQKKKDIRFQIEAKGKKEATKAFSKWSKNKLGITPRIVEGLIEIGSVEAFGVTYDASIVLSKLASKGTGFHEAFHLVFNNIFSKEQRDKILSSSGITPSAAQIASAQETINKLRENYEGINITAEQLAQEEILADRFRDYQLGFQEKGIIGRIFQRLSEFIKGIVGNKSEVQRIFEGISRGKYKNKIRPKVTSPRYQQNTGFSDKELSELSNIFLQMLDRVATPETLEKVYKNAFNSNPEKNTLTASGVSESALEQFIIQLQENDINWQENETVIKIIEGLRPDLIYGGNPRLGNLVPVIQQGLSKRGVTISTKLEDDTAGLSGQMSDKSISVKTNLTAQLKRFLANQYTGEVDSFGFGFAISVDPNEAYAILQTEIGDSTNVDHMFEKIRDSRYPWINTIAQLPGFENKGSKIVTQLYAQIGQKIHPEFKTILEEDGKVIETNRASRTSVIYNDLFDKVNSLSNKTVMSERITRYVNNKNQTGIDKTLTYFFDPIVITAIKKKNKEIAVLRNLASGLKKLDEGTTFSSSFYNAANMLLDYYPFNYQSAHLNVEGEKVYEWMNSNFIGRQLNKIAKNMKSMKEWYSSDPLYANLPILVNETKLSLGYVDGIKYKGKTVGVQPGNFSKKDSMYSMLMLYHNSGSRQMYASMPVMGDSKVNIVVKLEKADTKNEAINDIVSIIKAEYDRANDKTLDGTYKTHDKNKHSMSMFKAIVGENVKGWDGELVKRKVGEYIADRAKEFAAQGKKFDVDIAKLFTKDGNVDSFLNKFVADHIAATSQLMLLTTGDFAFYKSAEDFYKRAKEIHSPGTYLNTEATYEENGIIKTIPSTMRTRIETDIETRSPQANEIDNLLGIETIEAILKEGDRIIWGHPGIGKTTYRNKNASTVLDFDTDYKPLVAKKLGLPVQEQNSKGLNAWRNSSNEEEFKKVMREVWKEAVNESKSSGKRLVVSDMMFLRENENDFDKIITTSKDTFIKRAVARGDNSEGLSSWKANIDKVIANVTKSKLLTTNGYFSDLFNKTSDSAYDYSSLTDAQTYIDPLSYKWRMVGLGRWNEELDAQYDVFMRGGIPKGKTIWQTLKPFYYNLEKTAEGRIVPTQKKDSEFLVVPFYGREYINGKKNPVFNPEYKKMLEEMGYEFHSNSTMPVTFNESKREIDLLTFDTTMKVGRLNNGIASLRMDAWRLQMETPEHHIDSDGLFGTQIMKLIMANVKDKTLIREYNQLINDDIKRSYAEVIKKFDNEDLLREMLKDEVRNRNLGEDYIKALDDKEFPLWHPSHYKRVSSILNSLFKKKVTKRKLYSGGSFINTTAHGFERQPKIVWNKEGDPSSGINHFEAYAPIHNSKLDKYKNADGFIDDVGMRAIKASDDAKLLEGIVYRIPTEDKYSMIPIKIIGFMPIDNGNIVLPHEITTVAGLDFDIDKMFGFFYASNPYLDAIEKLKEKAEDITSDELADIISDLKSVMGNEGKTESEIMDAVNKIEKQTGKYEKLLELSKEADVQIASDNRKLDLMLSVLRSKDTVKDILTPQGFDRIKKVNDKIIAAQTIKDAVDVIDPLTLIEVKDRMNNGKQILGIYANGNAMHAILQQFKLVLRSPVIFDRAYTEFGKAVNHLGESITNNLGMRIGMAADNGKDPQASYYNANQYTAEVEVMLLQLGVPSDTVQYFLAQPGTKYFVAQYFNAGGTFQAEQDLLSELEIDLKGHKPEGVTEAELINGLAGGSKEFQLRMLKDFLYYKQMAQGVMKFQIAVKSADKGAGVTGSNNYVKQRAYSEEAKLKYAKVLDGIYQAMDSDNIMNTFMEYGIIKADKIIIDKAGMIKLTNGSSNFDHLVSELEDDKGFSLTEDEISDLVNSYIDYAMSEFYPLNVGGVERTIARLSEFKSTNPDHPLTSRLIVVEGTDGNKYIEFAGSTGMDEFEMSRVKRAWAELDNTNPKLSMGLIYYSIWQSGMSQGFKGFSHLQPFEFHQGQLKRVKEGLSQSFNNLISGDIMEMTRFKHQYVRNNFSKLAFVPSLQKSQLVGSNAFVELEEDRSQFKKYKGVLYYHMGAGTYEVMPALGVKTGKITRFYEYRKGKLGMPSKFYNQDTNLVLKRVQDLDSKVNESESKGDTKKDCNDGL